MFQEKSKFSRKIRILEKNPNFQKKNTNFQENKF